MHSTPKLMVALARGEAIRNFVYTGIIDEIARTNPVTVATVLPTPDLETLLRQRYQSIIELTDAPSGRTIGMVHDLLDGAHGRYLWSEAARERWRRHDLDAQRAGEAFKRQLWNAGTRAFARPRGIATLDVVYGILTKHFPSDRSLQHRLEHAAPSLIFNTSQVHNRPAKSLLNAGRALGIPTASFLFSWDNLTSQGRIIPMSDYFVVWNDAIRRDLLRIYPAVDPARVHVTGTPQFDAHFDPRIVLSREDYCSLIGVDAERPIVLYTTGMPNHMPGEDEIVEYIADLLLAWPTRPAPQLVVRVYAKDRSGRFDPLRARRRDIAFPPVKWDPSWLTPLPEDSLVWSNMLRHADVGINVASTVSLELCMYDRPIINVAFNPPSVPSSDLDYARYYQFDHYRPVVNSGAVDVAYSACELADAIELTLKAPGERTEQRRSLLRNMFGGHLDGNSSARVVASLRAILSAT